MATINKQEIYNRIDFLIKKYNPCKLNGHACRVANPSPCCIHTIYGKGLCPYSKNFVCTKTNLDCKLWFCETALDNMNEELKKEFYELEAKAKSLNLIRKPFLGEPYVGADK